MAERCEKFDLPVDQCSHCLKQPDPEQQTRREQAALLCQPGWTTARFRGCCVNCDEWYGEGTPIHIDAEERGWIGGCCAETLEAGR